MSLTIDQKMELIRQMRGECEPVKEPEIVKEETDENREGTFGLRFVLALCLFLSVFFIRSESKTLTDENYTKVLHEISNDMSFDFVNEIPYNQTVSKLFQQIGIMIQSE